jgi:hypothetical protein
MPAASSSIDSIGSHMDAIPAPVGRPYPGSHTVVPITPTCMSAATRKKDHDATPDKLNLGVNSLCLSIGLEHLCRRGGMTENKDNEKLFADLEALTEEQIEVGLAAGVWNEQVRPLVRHYLYDLKLKRVEAAAGELDDMRKGVRLAVEEAAEAKWRATGAFIVAAGALIAAMAAGLIAFLALRRYGFQPPW